MKKFRLVLPNLVFYDKNGQITMRKLSDFDERSPLRCRAAGRAETRSRPSPMSRLPLPPPILPQMTVIASAGQNPVTVIWGRCRAAAEGVGRQAG
jgi:hypothetical protein